MKYADAWVTGLVGLGFIMWAVFNHADFNSFIGGLGQNAVGLVSGIATVGKSGNTAGFVG